LEQWSAERWDYLIGQVRQHAGTNCQLDQQSRELIASVEFARAYGGSHVPDAEQCESRLALGTTRAQFQDLFVIDNWFDSDDFPIDVELLNAKIFQTFFR
jgi:hypothetical protein